MSNEVALIEVKNPALVFVKNGCDPLIDRIKEEVRKEQPNLDISTAQGRKAIASMAYKIAQSKTKLDEIGKSLTIEQRAAIDAVNEERGRVWTELEALQKEVRKPLTDWEEAEKKRVADHEAAVAAIRQSLVFTNDTTAEGIKLSMENLKTFFDLRQWEEFGVRATFEFNTATEELVKRHAAKIKADAEAVELARLQKAEADRIQKDREDAIAAEAKKKAEEKAAADAKALADKVEADKKKEADERAALAKTLADALEKGEADRRASEQAAIEAAHKAKVDAQKAAEKAAEDERKKVADEKAAEEKAAKEREADKAHKSKINNEALEKINNILTSGLGKKTEDIAKALVIAIAKGEIPNVNIKY